MRQRTRRGFLTGTAAGAALLAGCSSGQTTPTATDAGSATATDTGTEPYTVEMAPVGEVEFETVGNLGWRQLSVFDERVNSPDGYPVPGDVRLVHQVGRDAPRVTCHLGVTLFGLVYEPSDARSRPSYNACLR